MTLLSFDEIIQITILNGHGKSLFSSYIKPTRHKKWAMAQRVNGISYSMVKSAPTFREVKNQIQDIFNESKLVVGYNVGFDIAFVEAAGIIVPGTKFDVMAAFASYRAGIENSFYRRNCKLTECAEYFGYSFTPHDSVEDAKATLHCFQSLISDARFTTYKPKEKKKLKEELPLEKKKTKFTMAFRWGYYRSLLLGVFLIIGGLLALLFTSNISFIDSNILMKLVLFVRDNVLHNPQVIIPTIAILIGLVIVAMRIIRTIIMLPMWIVVHFKRLFGR